jgi:P-loop Domain of unknown function (DUF2791)
MAIATQEWIDLIEGEYLRDFVTDGGAGVKFAVGDADQLAAVGGMLAEMSERHGLTYVAIDAATTKLHMIQDVFFAIARVLDWNAMAQHFVESLFERQGYEWPRPGEAVPLHDVAACNRIDVTLLRRELHRWLTGEVMRDTEMTQDFRVAMARLCLRRLEPADTQPGITAPVLEWLRGELRRIGALKEAAITAKITRHNGRAMLRSLCRWLRLCGRRGLCVTLDVRQLGKTGAATGDGLRYGPAAVMDGFEVLRQLIDDAEHFAGLLLVVIADETLIEVESKRSLDAYVALKMRIWDDVRPEGRDNPLAPLVRLAGQPSPVSMRTIVVP